MKRTKKSQKKYWKSQTMKDKKVTKCSEKPITMSRRGANAVVSKTKCRLKKLNLRLRRPFVRYCTRMAQRAAFFLVAFLFVLFCFLTSVIQQRYPATHLKTTTLDRDSSPRWSYPLTRCETKAIVLACSLLILTQDASTQWCWTANTHSKMLEHFWAIHISDQWLSRREPNRWMWFLILNFSTSTLNWNVFDDLEDSNLSYFGFIFLNGITFFQKN